MEHRITKDEKEPHTPETGFNLVGIDPFGSIGNRLYVVDHYEQYQDALKAKKSRKNPDEYLILYFGA